MIVDKPGWYPQPFRPDGGITAEGLRNQLGRPSLSLLTVLARESAQNSWDARTSAQVNFTMELGRVAPGHLNSWRSLLGTEMPIADAEQFPLRQALRNPSITCLTISDRGTAGLSGPTRSDHASDPRRRNWLSFVLNSGEARDKEGGGGTYGYGKGIFFLVSRVGSVVIHSRFRDGNRIRSRLIGSVLWRSFTVQETPYTGRHWWGLRSEDHCEPLEDEAADLVARQLGLPGFGVDETGTTVVVIDPLLPDPLVEDTEEQLDLVTAGRFLADALAYNLWPITLEGRKWRLVPRVIVEGMEIPVPNEHTDPVISHFALAYRAVFDPKKAEPLMCLKPKRQLARFAHTRTFGATTESHAARDLGIEGSPHHVCLVRQADLVVRYFPGPPGPNPMVGYAGVAKVDDSLDDTFAKAEPPTHDAWIDSQLEGRDATFVRMLHKRIKERWDDLAGTKRQPADLADLPVAAVSRQLGHLLAGAGGGGPSPAARTTSPSGGPAGIGGGFERLLSGTSRPSGRHTSGGPEERRKSGTPRLLGVPTFVELDRTTVIEQRAHLPGSGTFEALVDVLVGDGRVETDAFVGAEVPQIIGWRLPDGRFAHGDGIRYDGAATEVTILVRPVHDAALQISVRASR